MDRSIPGLDGLTVNNIFCIGRNYALHAKEMKSHIPEEPIIFLKPNSTVTHDGGTIRLPSLSRDVHHEVELVVAIGTQTTGINPAQAYDYISGFGIGIDFTARDIQAKAKENGHPWSVAKGFDTFAPISRFSDDLRLLKSGNIGIELTVNDRIRQQGNTNDMIFQIPDLLGFVSGIFTLQPGDLLFTGTPEGVGPVKSGDTIRATLDKANLSLQVHVQ